MDSAIGQPLNHPDNIEPIHLLKLIAQSAFGPNGRCKMMQNTCGGHVTITSSASRLLGNLKVTNPVIKLIVSAANSHLRCHDNDGLYLILIILELLNRSLKLQLPQRLVLDACRKLQQSVLAHLQDCSLRIKVDFENLNWLVVLTRSILGSKPACCLSQKQQEHVSHLLIRGFLNGIPKETSSVSKFGNIHFVSHSGLSPDHCQLIDGLLVESVDSKTPDLPPSALKCALFHVSLSGDVEGGITEEILHLRDDFSVVESCTLLILNMLESLVRDGVAVVACQKVVHPRAKKYLQDHGVLVLDRLGLLQFNALTELTGGNPIETFVAPLDASCFGKLDAISVTTLHKKTYYHLANHNSNVSTLLLYNFHEESLEELKHVCHQGINALIELLQYQFVFCGGGCLEIHLAAYVRNWGKENMQYLMETGATFGQLASLIEVFAKSLESVAMSVPKHEADISTDCESCHLWLPSDSLSNDEETSTDNLQHCSCGAVTRNAADQDFIMLTPYSDSMSYTNSKLSESPLSEIQRNSLSVVDGALSKQHAIKTAFDIFVTILNVDTIIQKASTNKQV